MSVLDQQCRANATTLMADISSGGGGGGGSGNTASTFTSTLTVSTIVGVNNEIYLEGTVQISSIGSQNAGPNGTQVLNGLDFVDGSSIYFDANAVGGGFANINFAGNDGRIAGLSTINGAPYDPASTAPSQSVPLAGAVYVGTAPAVFTPSGAFSTVTGKYYWGGAQILDISLLGVPAPGDSVTFKFGQEAGENYIKTIDSVQTSTMRGMGGDVGFSMTGLVEAFSSYTWVQAEANTGALASTFVTLQGDAWLTPIN